MGLILPQTVKIRTNGSNCKHYREKGYTFKKCGDFIEVNVLDLPKRSNEKVKVVCDICGKEAEMCYHNVNGNISNGTLITCGSSSCKCKKSEGTCTKKYGVRNVFQLQETKDKIVETNRKNRGVDWPSQNTEVREKSIKTWQKNYGKNITHPMQVESIREKLKQTWLNNLGVDNPFKSKEIKNKVLDSFQFHGTGPCSRAQKYIQILTNGTLNKRICGSLVDIYIEKENIVIEHDGAGHFLTDIFNGNKTPTKEALLKEKNREDKIINNGYKMIRFIATKDRIPSDEVILNLIEGFKNLDFKVIRINFEEGTIDRDYEEKWYCNFGKLRKITKEDLERFENKKAINLK